MRSHTRSNVMSCYTQIAAHSQHSHRAAAYSAEATDAPVELRWDNAEATVVLAARRERTGGARNRRHGIGGARTSRPQMMRRAKFGVRVQGSAQTESRGSARGLAGRAVRACTATRAHESRPSAPPKYVGPMHGGAGSGAFLGCSHAIFSAFRHHSPA